MIAGLVHPDQGTVILDGKDVTRLPMHCRARLGLGYLPQEDSIFRNLSAVDNLLAILETRGDLNGKQRRAEADQLLQRFGIEKLRHSLAIALRRRKAPPRHRPFAVLESQGADAR